MGLFDRLFGQKNEQSQEPAETVASSVWQWLMVLIKSRLSQML